MTVAELRRRMSSREFAAWIAYDRLWPIGHRRLDLLFAHLCALVASALSGRRTQIRQFDLFRDQPLNIAMSEAERTAKLEKFKRLAYAITRKMGGTIKHGDGSRT